MFESPTELHAVVMG